MNLDFNRPFNHAQQLLAKLRERGLSAIVLGDKRRWRALANMLAAYRAAQRALLLRGETSEILAPEQLLAENPMPSAGDRFAAALLTAFYGPYIYGERKRETLRQFRVWLRDIVERKDLVLAHIDEDFQALDVAIATAVERFGAGKRAEFEFKPLPKTLLPDKGEWLVPLDRKLRLHWLSERIQGATLGDLIQRDTYARHYASLNEAVDKLGDLIESTNDYVKSLKAYVIAESDGSGDPSSALHERTHPLIDRFQREANAILAAVRERTEKRVAAAFAAIDALQLHSWMHIRHRFTPGLLQRFDDMRRRSWTRIEAQLRTLERNFNDWVDERLKPALGVVQRTEVLLHSNVVPAPWLLKPELPASLTDLLFDRRNPALLETPSAILKMVKQVRQQFDLGNRCTGLLLTDNLDGGMGLLAHALSIYFRDEPFRIFRHVRTRPLERFPDFEERVVFIENFERMVLLDHEHLDLAAALVASLVESDKAHVIAMHYRVAERLKLVAPVLSRFSVEATLIRYPTASFTSIIQRRLGISGAVFRYANENAFWAELYRASSGIPGVGLDLFSRCLEPTGDNEFDVAFRLPSIRALFSDMDIQRLLLLRRLYEQPFMPIDYIDDDEKPLLNSLTDSGMVIEHGGGYAIQRQFYGILRDVLQSQNLL